ncbi:unnamed protein product [Coffea canephora]|uniref:DH200=94 genomic scaffold, scaffold_736 n=1 Tax=Coffea canephora TaxID=49390 RepID=A0A068VJL0_COFCA|nr:unnamed protein product [Coffea canephora]
MRLIKLELIVDICKILVLRGLRDNSAVCFFTQYHPLCYSSFLCYLFCCLQVDKLILIGASVHVEGTGLLTKLPKFLAYAGVSLLKSLPLRLYANLLAFDDISLSTCFDWTNVGRLHCLLPWWEDATVNYMLSGGYNVVNQIKQV